MSQFIESDKELVWGGIPISLSVYDGYFEETVHSNAHTELTYKRTPYAINVIIKQSVSPVHVADEFSTVWNGTRIALSQDSDGKLYLNVRFGGSPSSPKREIMFKGMPIAIGEYDEIMFNDSGYGSHNIAEYSYFMVGGMPLTVGRVGVKWYLIVHSI